MGGEVSSGEDRRLPAPHRPRVRGGPPAKAPPGQAPLVLMVSDASVSLRMQSSGRYLPDLEYAMGAFLAACVVATHQLPPTVDDHGPSTLPVT